MRPATASRHGLSRPVRLDPSGRDGPTRADVRAGRWVAVWRGWFVPASVDRTRPEQRTVEASVLLPLRAPSALTGWAALRWEGAGWIDGLGRGGGREDITFVTSGRDVRPRPGITLSEERLGREEPRVVGGVSITSAVRSVCFVLRHATIEREAVVLGDMAVAAGLCTIDEVTGHLATLHRWSGAPLARRRLPPLADGSASPGETRMRLVWELDAGLPRPLRNVPIFDSFERHLATVDLLDPVAGLVGEYDGEDHLRPGRRRRDLRRDDALRGAGLEYVTMVAGDEHRRTATAARILAAHHRARREHPALRSWTLEQPAWWRRRHGTGELVTRS